MKQSVFHTEIAPSRICLGTAGFGSEISKAESFAVLDAYAGAGGNFIDTAHIYAAWIPGGWGASERTVGEWLDANGARDQVVLATKGGHPPLDNMGRGRCSRAEIEQDLHESLERLRVSHIDLYWLHRDDPERPVDEIIETLASLRASGLIRGYGASNWTTPRIDAANEYAALRGLPRLAANQPGWALADHETDFAAPSPMRYADEAMRRWHVETGLPLVAYSSQALGFFGEENVAWARAGFAGRAPRDKGYDTPVNRRRLAAAISLAATKGCSANQIALAFLLGQPFPVYPIVGTSKPRRIIEALGAPEIALTPEKCMALRREHDPNEA